VHILVLWALLIVFWLFSMYSVSIFESFDFTRKFTGEPSNYFYFFDQLQKLWLWVVLSVITYFLPLKLFKKYKYVIFALWILLIALLFTSLWADFGKWATLWLKIWWGTIQPWEFFKIWFVFFLSSRLLRKKKTMDDQQFFFGFFVVVALCLFVFLLLPDIGSLMVLWPVALIMYWFSWGRSYYVVISLFLGLIGVILASLQFSYVQERLAYFLDSSVDTTWRGISWQTEQALIAVWGWWRFGKWYGKGLQKFGYIPEAQSDFIFAAFSEEVWFLGSLILVSLYFLLAWYFLNGLKDTEDEYFRILWVGLLSLILVQAFINIGVNIKLIPLTWLTLPFLSHGWSALIVNMVEVVLLYKIVHHK